MKPNLILVLLVTQNQLNELTTEYGKVDILC
jgi:hypothetical protein